MKRPPGLRVHGGQGCTGEILLFFLALFYFLRAVLHRRSGTDDYDSRKAFAAGFNIVHINTELRIAWRLADRGFGLHSDAGGQIKLQRWAKDIKR